LNSRYLGFSETASVEAGFGLAAYAIWIAKKPATVKKTYGYHRVGILTALVNAATLIVIGILIFVEAYHLFQKPEPVNGTLDVGCTAVS